MSQVHTFQTFDRPVGEKFRRVDTVNAKDFRFFKPSCFVCLGILVALAGLSFWLNNLVDAASFRKETAHQVKDVVRLLEADMVAIHDIDRLADQRTSTSFALLIETTLHHSMNRLQSLPQTALPDPLQEVIERLKSSFEKYHDASHAALDGQLIKAESQNPVMPSLALIEETIASLALKAEQFHFDTTRTEAQIEPLAHLSLAATLATLVGILFMQFRRHRAHIRALEHERVAMGQVHRALHEAFDTTHSSLKTMSNLFEKSTSAARMTIFIQDRNLVFSWIHNPRFGGKPESIIGKSIGDILPPDLSEKITKEQKKVVESGKSGNFEFEFTKDGKHYFYLMQCDPLIEGDQVIGLIGMAIDITERHERDTRIESLVTELVHRRQNMITVINAMMRQTLRSSATEQEFEEKFSGRLTAIGRSLSFLTRQKWQSVCINQLIKTHLISLDEDLTNRITLKGQSVTLPPRIAEAFGDALHELIDNAKRHGALSTKHGQVELSWSMDHETEEMPILRVEWKEDDRTLIIPSIKQEGYGLTVLKSITPRIVKGETDLEIRRGGITWTITIPLGTTTDHAPDEAFVI